MSNHTKEHVDALIDPAAVVEALEGDRFRQFLDHIPVAVAVSELQPSEIVTYANLEFQRLIGRTALEIEGKSWRALPGIASADGDERLLRDAVRDDSEYIGVFTIDREAGAINVDVWSNTIEDEVGQPIYRLVLWVVLLNRLITKTLKQWPCITKMFSSRNCSTGSKTTCR